MTTTTKRGSLAERILAADHKMQRLLGNANEAAEAGDRVKASRIYEAAQRALDEYNRLTGRGS